MRRHLSGRPPIAVLPTDNGGRLCTENPCIPRLRHRRTTKVSSTATMPMFSTSLNRLNYRRRHVSGGKLSMGNHFTLLCAHSQPMTSNFLLGQVRQLVFHPTRHIPLTPPPRLRQHDFTMHPHRLTTRRGPLLAVVNLDRSLRRSHSLQARFPPSLPRNAYPFRHSVSQHRWAFGVDCHLLRRPINLRRPFSLGYTGHVRHRGSASAFNLRHHQGMIQTISPIKVCVHA